MYTISLMLALLSRASEEATFAFEASRSPVVVRAPSYNPAGGVVKTMGVQVHDTVQIDVDVNGDKEDPQYDGRRDSIGGGWRKPNITFEGTPRPKELDGYEMERI